MDTQFNEQDSLRLINEMISQTKRNFQRGSLSIVIFWGYLVAGTSIANFILLRTLEKPWQSYHVWWTMILGFVVWYFMQRKIDRTAIVKTHLDKIISFIWIGLAISSFVIQVVFRITSLPGSGQFIYFTPLMLIIMGMAQFITAQVCRYSSYYWGAVTFWLGAILCVVLTYQFKSVDYQFLVLAISVIISFVIPNHILNNKINRHV